MAKKGGSSGSSGAQTTTSSNAPPPEVMANYNALMERGNNVANTPYQAYGGQQVADLTALQQQGIQGVTAAAGMAQPYMSQAGDFAKQSAQGVYGNIPKYSQANMQQYMSPYTQNVIDTTMANINQNNALQQQQLMGHAIASGASPFGGDRAGVAAAELARQQNLASGQTMAGLQNQGFQNAQNQFNAQQQLQLTGMNADAQRQAQAAGLMGNLGTAAQNAALQGAQAQIGAGSLQQQQQQAGLDAQYQQWQQQQAYPFQTTQWLAGLSGNLGSQMGGTSSTTAPGTSRAAGLMGGALGGGGLGYMIGPAMGATGPMGAAVGAGLGALGSMFKDGGAIPHYANGGVTEYGNSWVPKIEFSGHNTIPQPPRLGQPQTAGSEGLGSASGLANLLNTKTKTAADTAKLPNFAPQQNNVDANGTPIIDMSTYNNGGSYESNYGANNDWAHALGSSGGGYNNGGRIKRNYGGLIPHYDDGGLIDNTDDSGDTYQMASEDIPGLGYTMASNMPQGSTMPRPPQASQGLAQPPVGTEDITGANNPGLAVANQNPQVETDKASVPMALMATGLGMMASKSPTLSGAIGEGGMAGMKNYAGQQSGIAAKAKEKALEQHMQNMDNKPQIITDENGQIQFFYPGEVDPKTGHKGVTIPSGIYSQKGTEGKYQFLPGTGKDEAGNTVSGVYKSNAKTGEMTFEPGVAIAGKGTTSNTPLPELPKDTPSGNPTRPSEVAQRLGINQKDMNPVQIRAQRFLDGLENIAKINYRSDPQGVEAANLAKQINPDLDETAYKNRQDTVAAFGPKGKLGQSVGSLNTVAEHLGELEENYKKLNNVGDESLMPEMQNKIGNYLHSKQHAGPLRAFNQTANKVSEELNGVYVPGGGALADRKISREDFQPEISATAMGLATKNKDGTYTPPPAEQDSLMRNTLRLVKGKMESLENQRVRGMGRLVPPSELYTPTTLSLFKRYGIDVNVPESGSGLAASPISEDPRIQKARDAGYTDEEIKAHLGKQ